jgi:Ca2+-binding RTX toxin-like protein
VFGGGGNDRIVAPARGPFVGYDYFSGDDGDDYLYAGGAVDVLQGGNGNDDIWGSGAADTMSGGSGKDRFGYETTWDFGDQIFDLVQGEDLIDLERIDANATLAGDQAFDFLADPGSYTGDWTGRVWSSMDAANGLSWLNISTNADGSAVTSIQFTGLISFTADDLVL